MGSPHASLTTLNSAASTTSTGAVFYNILFPHLTRVIAVLFADRAYSIPKANSLSGCAMKVDSLVDLILEMRLIDTCFIRRVLRVTWREFLSLYLLCTGES